MKNKYAISIAIVGIILLGYFILGPYDYLCYRCSAVKTRFIGVVNTDRSEWVLSITGQPCSHSWILNSTAFGLSDNIASQYIPISYSTAAFKYAIQSMPKKEWQQSIMKAISDDKNLLRWILLESISKLGDNYVNKKKTEAEWLTWKNRYDDLFIAEHDLDKAIEKADSIEKLLVEDYGKTDIYTMRKLSKDLKRENR